MYFDAHNHLQDRRFQNRVDEMIDLARKSGVVGMVVNGTTEADWPVVMELAERHAGFIRPAFGLHPWFVKQRSADWELRLQDMLEYPGSSIGEIGLDRWIEEADIQDQRSVFLTQLNMAAERNVAASIHCLQAWGELVNSLQVADLPERGFLLHSYGGSIETALQLLPLGAYFSFPGAFAREKKTRQRDVFRQLPIDRILVETDAPDQLPPRSLQSFPLQSPEGEPINHPANLPALYDYAADMLQQSITAFVAHVQATADQLFAPHEA